MHILPGNTALDRMAEAHLDTLAAGERLPEETILAALRNGTMVLLGNPAHEKVRPTLIGQPASIKVNANIGTSPLINEPGAEDVKLKAAEEAGAHTVMDLSTAGDLDAIRREMLAATPLPLGTVPVYALARACMDEERDPAGITAEEMLAEIESEARQGVDFMTVHCGVTARAARLARESGRVLGIVSRGGSILARWMEKNERENPFFEHYDDILDIARTHNVTLSLGDGLRPGAGADAGDPAQIEEVVTLGELRNRALAAGVQCMIEGPGHVPLHEVQAQIQTIKKLTGGAPLYVLGPLTTDSAPGYDHIAGAIGGAMAGLFGADFLCYLTPAEHLTLPDAADVRLGVMASRVAAHSAEVALGREAAVSRDLEISKARAALDWQAIRTLALDPCMVDARRGEHKDEKECAMCGKFCAIRMLGDV